MNNIFKFFKRLTNPKDWMLEKDIHDLEIELELAKNQIPKMEQRLRELRRRAEDYK